MTASWLERLRRVVPGLWCGVLLCLALVATPAIFAQLPRADAGRVVAGIFPVEAWLSLVLAVALLLLERRRAARAALAGAGSVLSTEMLLLLGVVFCTVAGYFAIQPMLPEARNGAGRFSFGQLHAASSTLFGVKIVLLALLSWRAAAPPATP